MRKTIEDKEKYDDSSIKTIIDMWENDKWRKIDEYDDLFSLLDRTEHYGAMALNYEINAIIKFISEIKINKSFNGGCVPLLQEMILHLGKCYHHGKITSLFESDFIEEFAETFSDLILVLIDEENNIAALEQICTLLNFYFLSENQAPFHFNGYYNENDNDFTVRLMPYPIKDINKHKNSFDMIGEWKELIKQWGIKNKKSDGLEWIGSGITVGTNCKPFDLLNTITNKFQVALCVEYSH